MHDETVQFLSALLRCDADVAVDTEMLWRVIPRKGGTAMPLRGSLRQTHDALVSHNEAGAGVFVQVNPATGTKDKDVVGVRALFVDNDVGPLPGADGPWPVAPNILVHSGHGDHAYWLVDGGRVEDFKAQQGALAAAMGTDPSICNPSRVMRVPGFWWTKPSVRASWKRVGVTVVSQDPTDPPEVVQSLTTPYICAVGVVGSEAWARWRLWCGCNEIRGAKPGESQNTFNRVAYAVKDFCRAGHLPEAEARRELAEAGADRGVDGVAATLNSAFNAPGVAKANAVALDVAAGGDGPLPSNRDEDLARALIQKWGGTGRVEAVGGSLYVYDEATGVWERLGVDDIRSQLTHEIHNAPYMKPDGTLGRLNITPPGSDKIAKAILLNKGIRVRDPAEHAEGRGGGLAFSDGFLKADGSFAPHGAENHALWRYEWSWAPKGVVDEVPTAWWDYFDAVWADCGPTERAQRAAFLGAWFGSALLGLSPRWGKVVFLLGEGNNGKSVLLRALGDLISKRVKVCVPIHKWAEDYFVVGLRPPAVLNVVSELPSDDWLASSTFKAVVTGDAVVGRPIFGAPEFFRPTAGHLFALNALPGSTDRSAGFWRRIAVIPFEVDFTGREESFEVVVGRLLAQGEDFLRWAIGWALVSAEMGSLPPFQGDSEVIDEWAHSNDPVSLWLEDRTVPADEGEWTDANSLYQDFRAWGSAMGFGNKSITFWGREMKRLKVSNTKGMRGRRYAIKLR